MSQKVWRNPKAETNKGNIFSSICPLLFRSYASDHLLTPSNSFLAFFLSLLLLSESAPLKQLAVPTPKLQIMILVLQCDEQNFMPVLQAQGKAHCSCLNAEDFPLPSSLRQVSQTGFKLFAHKCCSPTHASACTPQVHSFDFVKCRYSHQQNVHAPHQTC